MAIERRCNLFLPRITKNDSVDGWSCSSNATGWNNSLFQSAPGILRSSAAQAVEPGVCALRVMLLGERGSTAVASVSAQ